jgi:hypothetical protein
MKEALLAMMLLGIGACAQERPPINPRVSREEQNGVLPTTNVSPLPRGTLVSLATPTEPHWVTADNDSVFWSDSDAIFRMPHEGGAPQMLVQGERYADALHVHRRQLYWMTGDWDNSALRTVSVDGGVARTLGRARRVVYNSTIVFDNDAMYWPELGEDPEGGAQILRLSLGGGVPTEVVRNLVSPCNLVVDGSDLFWIEAGHIESGLGDAFRDGRVLTMPLEGGGIRELARDQYRAISLRVEGNLVYWLTDVGNFGGHQLHVVDRRGGDAQLLVAINANRIQDTSNQLAIFQGNVFLFAGRLLSTSTRSPRLTELSARTDEFGYGMALAGRRLYFLTNPRFIGGSRTTLYRYIF